MKRFTLNRKVAIPVLVMGAVILSAPFIAPSLTNTVVMHSSVVSKSDLDVGLNDIKPAECSTVTVDKLVSGDTSPSITGTDANELVLGSDQTFTFDGGLGNDCLISRIAGPVTMSGGDGIDVCVGNAETTFDASCETQYPPGPVTP